MARTRTAYVEPPRKPRAGWAEAAKALRAEQDRELIETGLDATREPLKEATYRCVDLDVRSRRSLAPLLAAWPNAQALERADGTKAPRWLLLTGASEPQRAKTRSSADQGVMQLIELVKALPPTARRCWKEATQRTFDIAIDAPPGPCRGTGIPVSQTTIDAVAGVGGRIVITVYPPEPD